MHARSALVVFSGDLDVHGVPAMRSALSVLKAPAIVDLSAVRFLDSSALNELVRLARRVGRLQVTLVVASANVRRVLQVVGFRHLFRIQDDGEGRSRT